MDVGGGNCLPVVLLRLPTATKHEALLLFCVAALTPFAHFEMNESQFKHATCNYCNHTQVEAAIFHTRLSFSKTNSWCSTGGQLVPIQTLGAPLFHAVFFCILTISKNQSVKSMTFEK